MKSFSILRTNVGLTTNVKVIVDSLCNLYLDSIESNSDLSDSRYKKFKFTSKNYYDELVPFFFKKTPIDISYDIKSGDDLNLMSSDFSNQYDELYNYGARNIISNKSYDEEFEYFAPLYITKSGIPSNFIVFRVDGPGIGLLTKENFITDISNSFKFVKKWDLVGDTNLSKWIDINFRLNDSFPNSPLEFDFKELEFCKWNGIDYKTGGWCSKSLFIDDIIDEEKEIFELERFIFDSFKNNGVVFPNIINFSFLFDDEPSTPIAKRKWSINRYYGFYLDSLELVTTISPYLTPKLKDDVVILEGNEIYSQSGDPFLEGWDNLKPFYIEYLGKYYLVEKYTEVQKNQLIALPVEGEVVRGRSKVTKTVVPKNLKEQYVDIEVPKWKIISDLNLVGKEGDLNKNYGIIKDDILVDYNNTPITIDGFSDYSIWLIEVDGVYHNLFLDGDSIRVNSDYSFNFVFGEYSYKVAGVETKKTISVDFNTEPVRFNIFRGTFTDIKDFDTKIVDTEYSKFEYEVKDGITKTDETKMWMENPLIEGDPKELDDFIWEGEVVNIPVSSEYTANYETFKVNKGQLSDIWRTNPVWSRWSFQNSISSNDYPYPLNNSFIFEDFNRTTNPFENDPVRSERNLDYFYTINSSTNSYLHHTLHVEGYLEDGTIDTVFNFDLSKYLNFGTYSGDYFTEFFGQKIRFDSNKIIKNSNKYSYFNRGDSSIPNISLFRGLKFLLYDVDSIDFSNGIVNNINLINSNSFDDWKLSILLSDNDYYVTDSGGLTNSNNTMDWTIISDWKMDITYATNSIVIFDNILYRSLRENNIESPSTSVGGIKMKSAPYNNQLDWVFETVVSSPFFNPLISYNDDDIINYYGDFYKYNSTGTDGIWDPNIAMGGGYSIGDKVFYAGEWFISLENNNPVPPNDKDPYFLWNPLLGGSPFTAMPQKRWDICTQSVSPKWDIIELWDPTKKYINSTNIVVHKDIVWKSTNPVEVGDEPNIISGPWSRVLSFVPDTNYNYPGTNPIIWMNNNWYLCNSNPSNSTLNNGINIYVNKKWKNLLININISDNTLPGIKNTNRDDLYTNLYEVLTASNFIKSINDINTKYGFVDGVNYIIVDNNGSITKYNSDNLSNLPVLLTIDEPDELKVKVYSLTKRSLPNPKGVVLSKKLNDGVISNLDQINWWSGLPYSMEIEENKFQPKVFENYHGGKNILTQSIWRYSGPYMPTFYKIELFDIFNKKFDIELTNFGIILERKIGKVSRSGSVLKLKNDQSNKSIYPMIDEFGLSFVDFFMFSSTWDWSYHYETLSQGTTQNFDIVTPTLKSEDLKDFGKSNNTKNINL